jgi:glycolate oxidase iron-sulfur subunit
VETHLADFIKDTPEGQEAEAILRKCVHCGFCTATCPTYQLLGDELDGPRGRIYLMKQVLEGAHVTASTQKHLDQCLTCRNCESTCPSGVEYGKLVDIGRKIVEEQVPRPLTQQLVRTALKEVLPRRWLFGPAMKMGQLVRPLLPKVLQNKVPAPQSAGTWPTQGHARKVILLEGCVQPSMMPNINSATARVLNALGIETLVVKNTGCCGALRFHMNDQDGGRADMRRNIDAWWPLVERGEIEAIVMNASGCGVTVKEYAHFLQHDAAYAAKAEKISALTRDISELVFANLETLKKKVKNKGEQAAAFHPPCTLQHGQKIRGITEQILQACGFKLATIPDSHLCCGSAGAYSVLNPEIAYQLRDNKLNNIEQGLKACASSGSPSDCGGASILSANIGCLTHLQSGTERPVGHWIEAVDRLLKE